MKNQYLEDPMLKMHSQSFLALFPELEKGARDYKPATEVTITSIVGCKSPVTTT